MMNVLRSNLPVTGAEIEAQQINFSCPWLPEIKDSHDFSLTRRHGAERGVRFYQDALRYAQSQWLAGKPAQAILQLNKAWMADLAADDPMLELFPAPYAALVWILRQAGDSNRGYLGNPVRHFQHLASRVSGPRAEIRAWRAWLCFYLAERMLDRGRFPCDSDQLVREGLWIPSLSAALAQVTAKGWTGEAQVFTHSWESVGRLGGAFKGGGSGPVPASPLVA